MTTEEDAIKALLIAGPPLFAKLFRPDCSIEAACIGIEALDYFAVKAEPLSVGARIFNAKACEIIDEIGGLVDQNDPKAEEYVKSGYYVALVGKTGEQVQPGQWDGHLLILTEHNLIDLTLGFASRPEVGMPLAPTSFERPVWDGVGNDEAREAFLQIGQNDGLSYAMPEDVKIIYALFPEDKTFRTNRGWNKKRFANEIGMIVRQMQEIIGSAKARER